MFVNRNVSKSEPYYNKLETGEGLKVNFISMN